MLTVFLRDEELILGDAQSKTQVCVLNQGQRAPSASGHLEMSGDTFDYCNWARATNF